VFSLTIPYHDTNDFYISGHVAWALSFGNEAQSCGDTFGTNLLIVLLFHSLYMMTVLYTHYIIDYASAVAFCFVGWRLSERYPCYLFDVKLLGFRGE
jgi:hypothetical protein